MMNDRKEFYKWLLSCPVEWRIATDTEGFTIVTFNYEKETKEEFKTIKFKEITNEN